MRAKIKVSGIVQGVGFRPFIYRTAVKNKLVGYVRNRGDGVVDIVVEGKKNNIKHFLEDLKDKKPALSRIYDVNTNYLEERKEFKTFKILKSSENAKLSGSVIPPDVSICDKCLKELRDSKNKRHNYFFITCTNCGPRYTIINNLPYDRRHTTMQKFMMCKFCNKEYLEPSNRRFHAQTVACNECGPKVYLTDCEGQLINRETPISEASKLLEEGYIVAIKGNGGFHVATSTTQSEPIIQLRRVKHRAQKPFAVMARNLDTVKSFAEVNQKETELLTSYLKPIVLLKKGDNYYLSELISPNLHNIGVMLPYTGLHVMLFDETREPAFVMTSANPPSEPIVKQNEEAIKKLGGIVDFFLLYNREIAHRCDDSVVRIHGKNQILIRRSRGYAPEPIRLKTSVDKCILGVGAELNVNSCILLGDKAFISPHIGNVENLETFEFLKKTINHMMQLTNSKIELIVCDMHPKFTTSRLAHELGKNLECQVVQVQHHHAHIASLMGEYDLSEMVGIACDGFGYGLDGTAWGGEILYCNQDGVQRLAHLQEQPIVGGDLATFYPLRMAAGILYNIAEIEEWLISQINHFPHGEKEVEIIIKQLKKGSGAKTTSCGRVLDAVSAILGICYERTYEGEPALKLESTATRGVDILNLTPKLEGDSINTTYLVHEIFTKKKEYSIVDLAYSAQSYLARALAYSAMEKARRLDINTIGFSGGVAYNECITQVIKSTLEKNDIKFLIHNQIPPGDGGISFGQTMAISHLT